MGLEVIVDRIRRDAREEADRILSEAGMQAALIRSNGNQAAQEAYSHIIERGMQEIQEIKTRILSQARLDAHRLVRIEREQGIERCYTEALRNLGDITQRDNYREILRYLISDGIRELDTGDVIIVSTEQDRPLVIDVLSEVGEPAEDILSHDCAIARGGVIIKSPSTRIAVDNTFEARLGRMKGTLTFEIAKILYGKGE